jgi:NADPH:quinone reductase-like Zn-dependent oxidoreductase
MKRIAIREFGGPKVLRIEDAETPRPGTGEVVVKIVQKRLTVHRR